MRSFLCGIMLVLMGCAGDYQAQYDASVESGDYEAAKTLMERQIQALSLRDYSPTLPLRLANANYRLAYAMGKLGSFDDMRHALDAAVNYDPGLTNHRQQMLEHFEVAEYNAAADAYNQGNFDAAEDRLARALSLVETEDPHTRCRGMLIRTMAIMAARSGNIERAMELCRQAIAAGDGDANSIISDLNDGNAATLPQKLPIREAVTLRFL